MQGSSTSSKSFRSVKRKTTLSSINSDTLDSEETVLEKPTKKRRKSTKANEGPQESWPEYFTELFKVFKALNTVLAFISSRKHLAITFPVVRASVESLLKKPLELVKVAELKALLPELIKFAYTPRNRLRIHGDRDCPDFSACAQSPASRLGLLGSEEHVLILEFVDKSRGKKSGNPAFTLTVPPALTPAATKKLVAKRNERFVEAINELILATPATEDPVALLQAAGHSHIPVNPSSVVTFCDMEDGANLPVPDSKDRPTIDAVIQEIEEQRWYNGEIVVRRVFEPKEGQIAVLDPPLSDTIMQALKSSRKISSLYIHQVAAITALDQGKNVIVSTSTASGKSVIYQAPFLRFLEEDLDATAIFVYPTKVMPNILNALLEAKGDIQALAQDQRAALEQLLYSCPGLEHVKVATYDGDTPEDQRAGIRETASVIFTNFDMMHASILPHEDLWRRFLKSLKLVAVDELHYYSNIFGSHVAQVIRRFRRICAAVGNRHPRFVSCSATISNPMQHMKNIFGVDDIVEITDDGAPSGRKDFLIWCPRAIDPMAPTLGQRSALSEATGLMRFLMKRGIRVILFCKIRKICELAMKTMRTDLSAEGRLDVLERVMPYRGGYSQQDRRRIEHEAFSGNLLGIIATNALELGVDIGVLDAVIMLGFPTSIASFRQQTGRAGRRARDSLAVLVVNGPIDHCYANNLEELFDKPTDDLVVDLESKVILEAHLQCAGHEMPLSPEDEVYFGPLMPELCRTRLMKDRDGWYHTHPRFLPFPAKHVAIRGVEEEKYAIVDIANGTILEEVEISRALFEIYEGAVFIHQGLTFIIKEVHHDSKIAKLIRADVNWITEPRDFTDINAVQTYRIREIRESPHRAFFGRVEVVTEVFGYFKIRGGVLLDVVDLETLPWRRETTGMWIDVPKSILELMRAKEIKASEAIHAAQHAFLNRFVMADDLKTECKVAVKEYKTTESQRTRPGRLIFYDAVGKGGGVAAKAFDHVHDLLRKAYDAVEACDCPEGCANCVRSPSCRENNEVSSKIGALIILQGILGIAMDADSIAAQHHVGHETVVVASSVRAVEGIQVEVDVR